VTIPYFPVWSFGESLPALTESPRNSEQVTYSIASLAALLARRLEDVSLLIENRDSYVESAQQAARREYVADVFVSHSRWTAQLAREFALLLEENGLTVVTGDPDLRFTGLERRGEELIDRCRHLVMIVDERGPEVDQSLDISHFLRKSVNSPATRLALPVVTTGAAVRALPRTAQSLQAYILTNGTLPQAARVIAARIRQSTHEAGSFRSSQISHYDVYMSYTHADANWTMALAENLQRLGLGVWIDEWELRPGDHWPTRLEEGLDSADTVVCVVSPNWDRANWAVEEFGMALERGAARGQRVIPVLTGDVRPSDLPDRVTARQWVDFRAAATPKQYVEQLHALARLILGLPDDQPLPRSGSVVLPDSMF
jgi:hypothetical protein